MPWRKKKAVRKELVVDVVGLERLTIKSISLGGILISEQLGVVPLFFGPGDIGPPGA